jgi:uncharacterized protein YciI
MYILLLDYVKPLEEIDAEIDNHAEYLERHYTSENFICSGRRKPRTGGVILCNAKNKAEVEAIINEDPFKQKGLANYTIIEFSPSKCAVGFESFI